MAAREWEFFADALDSGNLNISARKKIANLLDHLKGKRIRIRINVVRRQRSNQQNRYYWGVIIAAAQEGIKETWGIEISDTDAHEILKRECNGKDFVNENTGEVIKVGQSTTELNKLTAEDYYETCRRFIQEWFGILVPLPNEQLAIDLESRV
jgi:hypothetical protein